MNFSEYEVEKIKDLKEKLEKYDISFTEYMLYQIWSKTDEVSRSVDYVIGILS